MKAFVMFLAVAIAAVATIAASRDAATTADKTTASGEIVRYDAGKTIVLRHADDRVVTYAISPSLIAPVEVQVGRRVSLVAEPGADGIVRVTQLTTLAADAAPSGGQIRQTTTYTHETGSSGKPNAVTVTGDVVRYEAGRSIVVRAADGPEVTYALAPGVTAPAELTVGRRVSIVTEPSSAGPVLVTRITGEETTAAETTALAPAGEEAKSQITTVYGTVTAYEPGRSITVAQPDEKTVTYAIDRHSVLPARLARGRRVVVRTIMRPGLERPLVRKVTFTARKAS